MDTRAWTRLRPVRAVSLTTVLALALLAMATTGRPARPRTGATQGPAARRRYPMVN